MAGEEGDGGQARVAGKALPVLTSRAGDARARKRERAPAATRGAVLVYQVNWLRCEQMEAGAKCLQCWAAVQGAKGS